MPIDQTLLAQAQAWFEAHRGDILRDIGRLVRIRSVATYEEPPTPFGRGCKAALEEMLALGREHGFLAQNIEDKIGCLSTDSAEPSIGLWVHLDVVPEGDPAVWVYPPFETTLKDGFLIGRGVDDNKGPAIAALYVLQCLRELNVPLRHALKLFAGCDEEHGMADVQYYAAHHPCPALSIIPDTHFPVCYAEKGILEANLAGNAPLSSAVLELSGGVASNVVPAAAHIVLRRTPGLDSALRRLTDEAITYETLADRVVLRAQGVACHSASPDKGVNAIALLTRAVTDAGLLSPEDTAALAFLAQVNSTTDGTYIGIRCHDDASGDLTCAGTRITLREGHPVLHLNIRYCVTAQGAALQDAMRAAAAPHGFTLEVERDNPPGAFPREHPIVDRLTAVYNEISGASAQPYVMGGGTYARKLPNAFAYGLGGLPCPETPWLAPGHGDVHGPDEAMHVDSLLTGMAILAMALIEADALL
jgi:succinyl-diaminopimelate desuccinylase